MSSLMEHLTIAQLSAMMKGFISRTPYMASVTFTGFLLAYELLPNKMEETYSFLLFQQPEVQAGGPMLILAAKSDLEVLHGSSDVVSDGMFDYCPTISRDERFHQLYPLHGFSNIHCFPPHLWITS